MDDNLVQLTRKTDTTVYVVIRRGNRDFEDCEWFEATPDFETPDEFMVIKTDITKKELYGQQ